MRIKYIFGVLAILACLQVRPVLAGIAEGKELFFNRQGTYGSCATCHPGGGSAGKWDSASKTVSTSKGKKIPNLKGIANRRTIDQTKRLAAYYAKEFGVKLSDTELQDVVMWLYMANK